MSFDKSNLEDDRPPLSATIASHAGNRDLQNAEMAQDGEPMPNIEELIFDLSEKDLDTLESRSILTKFYLEGGQHKKAIQLFQQTLEAYRRSLGNEYPIILSFLDGLAENFHLQSQEMVHAEEQIANSPERVLVTSILQFFSERTISPH